MALEVLNAPVKGRQDDMNGKRLDRRRRAS